MNNLYAPTNAPLREPPRPPAPPRWLPYEIIWVVGAGALAGLAMRALVFWGEAGNPFSAMLVSFLYGTPIIVGMLTVYLAERRARRSWSYYFIAGMLANVLYILGSLLVLIEGWICAIVIFPLFALIGGLSGLVMGIICRVTNWPRSLVVGVVVALTLAGGAFEHHVPTSRLERVQQREIFVAAPADRVWREIIDVREVRRGEIHAWMNRIGVPPTQAAVGELRDGRHVRHVTMGKGIHFDQVATEWRENERVSWRYRFDADSFPPGALDDHVRIGGDYFDLGESTYALTPEAAGTRLTITMRYRVSTHFNWYAGRVADLLVGDFTEEILGFYARRAEHAHAHPAGSPAAF